MSMQPAREVSTPQPQPHIDSRDGRLTLRILYSVRISMLELEDISLYCTHRDVLSPVSVKNGRCHIIDHIVHHL